MALQSAGIASLPVSQHNRPIELNNYKLTLHFGLNSEFIKTVFDAVYRVS